MTGRRGPRLPLDGPVADPVTGDDVTVRRAWPRRRDHALVELEHPDGTCVAGQWFADAAEAERLVARTPGARALGGSGLVVQPAGRDHRLPALAPWVAVPGARLVVHRPGRRGVVRHRDGSGATCYTKVLRPGRSAPVLAGLRRAEALAAGGGFRVPGVLGHRPDEASVTCQALGGTSLHDLAGTGGLADRWHATGRAVAALHRGDPAPGLATHDAAAEAAVTERWVDLAEAHGRLAVPDLDGLLGDLRHGRPGPVGVLHRDLHDKQVLVEEGAGGRVAVGLLDLDTLATGERALDVANLLVHLELRVAQGRLTEARAGRAADALAAGAGLDAPTRRRLGAHATAARLRLAAVYAFRPRWSPVVDALVDRARSGAALPG